MKLARLKLIILIIFLQPLHSHALDMTSATRMSIGAVQNLLVSPPLPTLDAGGDYTVAPSLGLTTIKLKGSALQKIRGIDPAPPPLKVDYEGKISGYSQALGLTSPTYGRFGFFVLLARSQLEGKIDTYIDGAKDISMENIKATSTAGVVGVSYRFVGDQKSRFAAGVFLGPGMMSTDSFYNTVFYSSISPASEAKFKVSTTGAYVGLQTRWRFGKFLINPYILQFQENSKKCEMQTTAQSMQTIDCELSKKLFYGDEFDPNTSFTGYGVFLGYANLRLNAYSKANLDAGLREFEFSNYSLSYSFGF